MFGEQVESNLHGEINPEDIITAQEYIDKGHIGNRDIVVTYIHDKIEEIKVGLIPHNRSSHPGYRVFTSIEEFAEAIRNGDYDEEILGESGNE